MSHQAVPQTMTAAILEAFHQPYVISKIPTPAAPHQYDILVRVLAASYCHTDGVFCQGSLSQVLPRIGCHEFAGEVVAAGPLALVATGVQVGVPGRAYHPCSNCHECRNNDGDPVGYSPYCPKAGNLGLTADGGFQEYCLVDSRQVATIPPHLTALETAPLMCAGLTVWAALHQKDVCDSKSVVIMGAAGGLGNLGLQFAAKLGKRVLAVDVGPKAMAFLQNTVEAMGEEGKLVTIVDATETSPDEALEKMGLVRQQGTEGETGVDSALILPEAQQAFDYGVNAVKNHGVVVVVSFPDAGFNFSAKDLVFRDIKLVGSLVGRNRQLQDMLAFAAKHDVRATTRSFALQQLNQLVDEYKAGSVGKLIVDMSLNNDV